MSLASLIKSVTVVIVTYNSESVIDRCLASIPKGIKVLVIDNASTDKTCHVAGAFGNDITLIQNNKNLGFGVANNIGLARVKTDYALIINPDVMLTKEALTCLVKKAKDHKDAAILGPALRHENGNHQISYVGAFGDDALKKMPCPEGDACVDFILGAAMLFRISKFTDRRFFDPNIFLFYEDDDICMRVKEKGDSLIYVPTSVMSHSYGGSSKLTLALIYKKNWHLMRSYLYLCKKYNMPLRTNPYVDVVTYAFKAFGYLLCGRLQKSIKNAAKSMSMLRFYWQ